MMAGRVSIVSPMSPVAGYRAHLEEGRGRGTLSVFLLVPEDPPDALSKALEQLHDPRGPADLDLRLGQLAAQAPEGTAFLVALESQIWVFPSNATEIRLLRDGVAESLGVPQVVRLEGESRVEVVAKPSGEAIALASLGSLPSPPPSVRTAPTGLLDRVRTRPSFTRLAALIGGSAALLVFVFFRVFAARPTESSTDLGATEAAREDAWVEPDLESRVLGALGDPSRVQEEAKAIAEGTTKDDASAAAESGEVPGEVSSNREKSSDEKDAKSQAERDDGTKSSGPKSEWTFRARAPITSSPLLVGGAVVFGSRDSTLYCLDAESGALRWACDAGSGVGSSPRAARGICVVGTYAGRVLGVDLKSGKRKWEGRTGGKIVSSPCLLEDLAVIGSNDGRVHAFRLSDGEKVWAYETKGAVRASPEVIGPDRVVIGSQDGTLHAIDARSGRAAWKVAAGSAILAGAAFDEGSNRVIAGTKDGRVLCVAANDGKIVWNAKVGSTVNAKPRIADGRVLVGTNGGKLYALDLATGESRWSAAGKRGFEATPAVAGEVVVAPSYDGTVHFLGASDGKSRGTRSLGSEIWSSPAMGREIVYVGTFAGSFHALAVP